MKRISLAKIGVIVMSSCIPFSMMHMLDVQASNQGAVVNTDLTIDGPTFYQLNENGEVKEDYKVTSQGTLVRYEKELQDIQAGYVRSVVHVKNTNTSGKPVRLISVLEDKNDHSEDVLEVSEIDYVEGNASVTLSTDVQIPSDGNYEFKTYLWDEVNGMIALKNTTVLSSGATNLQYTYNGEYNRDNPSIILSWDGVQDATSYDIYVEGKKVGTSTTESYTMDLQPYTAYKISVQAIREDGKYAAMSNSLYFMSEDTQASQDVRMEEWNRNRFGMFIHWGGYATFAGVFQGIDANGNYINYDSAGGGNGAYSEWIKFGAAIPDDTYKANVDQNFTAENYDPAQWVQIAKDAGMKYIVLTSKHHEGLSLFNTATKNGWSVQDTQAAAKANALAEKDFLKQLILEGAKEDIDVGVYYSQSLDWAQPGSIGWTPQRTSKWSSEQIEALKQEVIASGIDESVVQNKIYDLLGGASYDDMVKMNNEVIIPQVEELLTMKVNYNGKEYGIDTLWWDMGQHNFPEINYEIMKKVTQVDTEKKIKMNNRILHEDHYTTMPFDFITPEQSIPSAPNTKYWETCMTMNDNWGYAKNDDNWKQSPELIENLTRIASMGGNFLMNVGPKADGSFPKEAVDLLGEVGDYMDINGEAIYGTSKSPFLNALPWGYATQKKDKVYLHILQQDNLESLIVPGLTTIPKSARVITGPNEYSQPLQIQRNETYKGFTLSGDALTPTHPVGSVIVLQFDNELISFEECNEKFPVIQNAITGVATLKASDANVTTSDPANGLILESGGNFGRWNNEQDYATWNFKATKVGTYTLDVDYATPMKGSLYVQVKDKQGNIIAEAKSQFEPSASKDEWVTYKNQLLGIVDIAQTGEYTVEIHRENSGPDASSAHNGPVNITSVHMKSVQEYAFTTQVQDIVQKQLQLPSSKGIRSGALGYVGADINYGMKQPASALWKVEVTQGKEFDVYLHGATDGKAANVFLSLKDENMNPIIKDGQPITLSQSITTPQWIMSDTCFQNTLTIEPGTYYVDMKLLQGTMNLQGLSLRDAGQLELSSQALVFDRDSTSQTITSNKPITITSEDSSILEAKKVNDKEWTITKLVSDDAITKLEVKAVSDATQVKDIEVQILNGKINEVSSVDTNIEEYVSIYNGGSPTFEQAITSQLQGKGIYKVSMKYRSKNEITYALGVGSDWTTGKLPSTTTWKEATTYLPISYNGDVAFDTIFKPIDNFGSIGIADAIDIASISIKKLASNTEVIQNPTLSNGLDQWNRNHVEYIKQDKENFYLRAYDATLENSATDARDLVKEANANKPLYGQLGNWWDINDAATWDIDVKVAGYYHVNAFFERLWNETYMKAEFYDKNNQLVGTLYNTIVDDGQKEREMGLLYLNEGTYKIKISRKPGENDLFMPVGMDIKLAKQEVMNACVQDGNSKKLDCSVGKAVASGESIRKSNVEASYWNKKEESLTWKIQLDHPQKLSTVLYFANDVAGAVGVTLYDSQGNIVLPQTTMNVNRLSGWGNYDEAKIGELDLSSLQPGTYFIKLHNTGEQGINLKTLILE